MAPRRKPRAPKETQDAQDVTQSETVTETSDTNTSTNTNTQERKSMSLTPDQIASLLGQARSKGQYITRLNEFVKGGDGGVNASDWPEFADKKANTVKQGFENAKNSKNAPDGSDNVKVIVNDEKVYLINLTAAGVTLEDAVAE